MRTINKIITEVNGLYGAPMGRYSDTEDKKPTDKKVFDCKVPINQGYDKGGVYWGYPDNLRVQYTKDLSYVHFYRTY